MIDRYIISIKLYKISIPGNKAQWHILRVWAQFINQNFEVAADTTTALV